MSVGTIEDEFRRFLSGQGLEPADGSHISASGQWRNYTSGQGRCSAVLNADGCPRGTVIPWKLDGVARLWTPEGIEIQPEDRRQFERDDHEAEQRYGEVAAKAAALFDRLGPVASKHRYLKRKEIGPGPCRVSRTGRLAVPIYDATTGKLISIQWIRRNGDKRFMAGGRTKNGCCVLGTITDVAIICEGFATAASLNAATGYPTIAAFSAGNLESVADTIRKRFPDTKLIIAADNDTHTENNPGVTKAEQAARAVGGYLAVPTEPGDFNDLAVDEGPKAVRTCIKAAQYVRPVIQIKAGELPRIVHEAIASLRAIGSPIYNRGGQLVRPVRTESSEIVKGIRRPEGSLKLEQIEAGWISLRLSESAEFRKFLKTEGDWTVTDPPERIARKIVEVPDEVSWRPLRTVVRVPVLKPNGDWVGRPGYDPDGHLLVDISGEWPEPGTTRKDARRALRRLRRHFRNMPWADSRDESVGTSLLLTAVMRPVLDAAPMHAIDAPAAGTGKSLFVDSAAILATGARAAVMDWGKNPEEAAKRLDAALLAGDSFLAIDNVEAVLDGAALCQTLTQQTRRIRVLGSHEMPHVPCSVLIAATGNNLTIRGDLARRSLICRLDAKTERPDKRLFDQDLISDTFRLRQQRVADAQTIIRAYIKDGQPDMGLAPLGLFRDWSDIVRSALVWLGLPDPAESVDQIMADDPARQELSTVLGALYGAFDDDVAVTVAEIIDHADGGGKLAEALEPICKEGKRFNSRKLSWWLRKNRDVLSGPYRLIRTEGGNRTRWRVLQS